MRGAGRWKSASSTDLGLSVGRANKVKGEELLIPITWRVHKSGSCSRYSNLFYLFILKRLQDKLSLGRPNSRFNSALHKNRFFHCRHHLEDKRDFKGAVCFSYTWALQSFLKLS